MAYKTLTGIVTSDSRDKTITVTVTSRLTHPLYGKQYTASSKYQAHDENNDAGLGDKVTIVETTPISKTKSFKLQSIDERAKGSIELREEDEVVEKKEVPKAAKADAEPETSQVDGGAA